MPFITVVEFAKLLNLDKFKFTAYSPFVYSQKLSFFNYISYFIYTYGADNDVNIVNRNIIGVEINDIDYAIKTSLLECEGDEESFYFDLGTQTIYIHLNHGYHIFDYDILGRNVIGYSNLGEGEIKYYNDISYLPELLSIPSLDISVNPGDYSLMAFFGGSFVFNNYPTNFINLSGFFDKSYQDCPEGNLITLLYGDYDDPYASLLQLAKFGITNHDVSLNQAIFTVIDQRELLKKQIPEYYFTVDDYPDIGDNEKGNIIPLAFGICYGIPGICIDTNAAGNKTFKVPSITILFDVWVQQINKIWIRVTPVFIDDIEGLIEIDETDIYDTGADTGILLSVKVDGIFGIDANTIKPSDIIKFVLDEYYNINYDTSNYDTTEWESEGALLDDIGIYIDSKKTIYDIIEELQNSSNFGFYYEHIFNQRTIRVDNQNRAVTRTIEAVEIINIGEVDYSILKNDYVSHADIGYSPDYNSGKRNHYQNNDYYETVLREYDNENEKFINTNLPEEQSAIDRSVILLEDMQKARLRTAISIFGLDAFNLRVLDIVNADLTQYYLTNTRDLTISNPKDREFLGVQRYKIIARRPDLKNGIVNLSLRQCDYSDTVETIINNKSLLFDHMQYYDDNYFNIQWLNNSGSGEISFLLDGSTKVLNVGNNAGDDMQWVYHTKLIRYESDKLYQVRIVVKQTLGAGTVYAGIEGIASDGVTMVNINGADSHNSQHYFAAEGDSPGAAWTEYTGYFTGAALAGNGGKHTNSFDPGTVHSDAYYIRGMFIVNYNGAVGTTLVKEFQIRKYTNI